MLQDDSIHIKGTNYAYKVKGRGERLVLLHGFTASSKTWDFACEQLASRFQVMRIDLPGHGETTGNSVKTVEDFASDLAQIFQELKIKKAHILGYSMGGRAALTFALLYPELVDSLILESASPGIEGESERLARQEADEILAKRLEQDGIEEFVTYWENIPLFASQKNLPGHVKQAIRTQRLEQSAIGLANSLRYFSTGKQPSWWGRLGEIDFSVLLIVGGLDRKFVDLNERMVSLIKGAELVVVPDVGHAVHIEQLKTFLDHVELFLNTLEEGK